MEIGKVGINHRHLGAVHGDAAPDASGGGAVDIAAVEDDIGGDLPPGSLPTFGLQVDNVIIRVGPRARGGAPRGDFDPDEPVVVGGGGSCDGGRLIGGVNPGHQARMRGKDTSAGVGEKPMRRRTDVDPAGARFLGQDEVPGEGGAGLRISITFPGWEALRAAWRSPPALTAMSLARVGGELPWVSRKTRGNSGPVWARARAGSRGVVETNAGIKASRARRAGVAVPEKHGGLSSDINPDRILPEEPTSHKNRSEAHACAYQKLDLPCGMAISN